MRSDTPTYRCDAVGCHSYVTLDPREPDRTTALTARGWRVCQSPAGDGGERHYCPGCKTVTTSAGD